MEFMASIICPQNSFQQSKLVGKLILLISLANYNMAMAYEKSRHYIFTN
jgi:hypothetical protein